MAAALKLAAVAAVVIALYAGHVGAGAFVYEDARMVHGTADRAPQPVRLLTGRGLTLESWTVVRSPRTAHALNVALHLLVVGLVWALAGRLFDRWTRDGIALLVALHPLTIETVAYATSRAELLAAIGVLLSLLCVTARSGWAWVALPITLWFGYAGKETAIAALPLMPLVLWAKRDRLEAAVVACAVIGAAGVIVLSLGSVVLTIGPAVDPWRWALVQSEAIWRLVVLSVVPIGLTVSPPVTGTIGHGLAAFVLLIGLLEVAWRCRTSHPRLAFGLLWCAIVAAPRLLVRTPGSPFNEHQWYLAMPGVACVLMAGVTALADRLAGWRAWRVA